MVLRLLIPDDCWRKISITLITPPEGVLSVIAWFQHLAVFSESNLP